MSASKGTTTTESGESPAADLDGTTNNQDSVPVEEDGHEFPLDEVAKELDGSRDSPLNVITEKIKGIVDHETETIKKFTRMDLVGITVRQATTRWNAEAIGKSVSSSPTTTDLPAAPPVFTDVRTWRCMTVSVIMTILFYSLCIGSIFVVVFLFFWWWFVWRPENGESLVNQTTVLLRL